MTLHHHWVCDLHPDAAHPGVVQASPWGRGGKERRGPRTQRATSPTTSPPGTSLGAEVPLTPTLSAFLSASL